MVQEKITQKRLKEVLDYDPDTGVFTWKVQTNFRIPINSVAGKLNTRGYRSIKIDKKDYLAHRLVWLYVHGEWPPQLIDHINGDKLDNRLCNIRCATYSQNNTNRINARGYSMVGKMFHARIVVKRKGIHLGSYKTAEEARQAYLVAQKQLHFS
jgi:hypothetical protein